MAGVKGRSGGRNRKSTQLHVLKGTFRQDRHGDGVTPEPPKGDPTPPRPLTGEAKAEWNRMVRRLHEARTLSLVDDAALYQYVQLHAETQEIRADNKRVRKLSTELKQAAVAKLEATELVEAIGHIVKLQFIIAKQTAQLRMGHMALRMYLVEFGMTPAARTRVKVSPGAKPKSTVEQWKTGAV
jgi:P27 family predicted phage terminase small subunit